MNQSLLLVLICECALIGTLSAFQCHSCIGVASNSFGICNYKKKEEVLQKVTELLPDVKLEVSDDADMCIRMTVEQKVVQGEKGSWVIKVGIKRETSDFEGIDIDKNGTVDKNEFCMGGKKLEDISAIIVCGCSTHLCNGNITPTAGTTSVILMILIKVVM